MQAVLDRPVSPEEVGQPSRAGLSEAQAGDRVDDHGVPRAGAKVTGLAGDLDDLGGVREAEVVDGDGLDGTQLDAAVAAVAGAAGHGNLVPGQPGQALQHGGLVGLDDEQVMGLLSGDQELGGLAVGLQGVCCGHASKVQVAKQWLEGGDLAGAPSTWPWASTAWVVWSIAASRWTWRPWASASSRPSVRRMVVSLGTLQRSGLSRRAPSATRTGWGASAAHSAIAVIERAPPRTAAAAMARMAMSGWPRPRGLAGRGRWPDSEQVRWFGLLERVGIAQWVEVRRDRG